MSKISNYVEIPANKYSGNRYWNGGAFCRTCGYLKGNIINDNFHPIYHPGCRLDCFEMWEAQEELEEGEIDEMQEYFEAYEKESQTLAMSQRLARYVTMEPYSNYLEYESQFTDMIYEMLIREDNKREERETEYFAGVSSYKDGYEGSDEV